MSIPATEAIPGATSATGTDPTQATGLYPTGDTGAAASTGEDKQMFLQLLVAQLRYQDPMNPADSGEFLAQSAQFTALEKMQDVADQTAALLASQVAFGASGLVGKQVTYLDQDGVAVSGQVESVTYGATGPTLLVGGAAVTLGQVQSVDADPTAGSTTDPEPDPEPDSSTTPVTGTAG